MRVNKAGRKPRSVLNSAKASPLRRKREKKGIALPEAAILPEERAIEGGSKMPAQKRSRAARSQPIVSNPTPLTDEQVGAVDGIPSEEQIAASVGQLSPEDRRAFARMRKLLAEHLGSYAAGRLWMVTPSPGFTTTPLDAVRDGQVKRVLAILQSQWGRNPTYA